MNRAWWGTAALAASWLLGLGYFSPASPAAWVAAVVVGVVLLAPGLASVGASVPRWMGGALGASSLRRSIAAVLLVVPAAIWMPWPYKAIPLLLGAGVLLQVLPEPRRWLRSLGEGAVTTSLVLLAQALTLWLYAAGTARQHELGSLLTPLIGWCLRLAGLLATVDGSSVVVRSGGEVFRLSATWDLLVDPSSLCFLTGSCLLLVLLGRQAWSGGCQQPAAADPAPRAGRRKASPAPSPPATSDTAAAAIGAWLRAAGRTVFVRLLAVAAIWLPLRAVMLIALVLHRGLRSDPITAPNVADVLVNSGIHVALLGGLAGLVSWLVRWPANAGEPCLTPPVPAPGRGRQAKSAACMAVGVALLVGLLSWAPVGARKAGRVLIVEKHSTWEPTTEPYGTKVYGERGSYNYAAAYDYCGQYFEMSRLLESEALNDVALAACDVLVIKTPTARYAPDEVEAIERFVAQGGSLLLVGDHTNVFRMSTCLNDIARRFGFSYRNDLLFRVGSPYQQRYTRPLAAHPAVQHVPQMDFAVSCSIDPGSSPGRMAIRSPGLYNLPPAYQEVNYHPQAEYRPYMQYGAWCQLWSTTHGRGRVLAFADSTLFSNFCVFQPGKAELLRGMLEWLNHSSPLDRRGLWLLLAAPWALAGLACVAVGWWSGRGTQAAPVLLVAAGLAGWAVGIGATSVAHRRALPEPPCLRPLPHVVIDRTLSDVPLFTGAFTDGPEGAGYGMFEQWIPRLGNSQSRRSGEDVFGGDALVVICPTRSVPAWYRERLVQFVEAGGRLLVLDSADVSGSTANSLLGPFGLASHHIVDAPADATLTLAGAATEVTVESPCEITGGVPLAKLGELPVAAQARYGQGTVTALGCGTLFNDANMGVHWLPEPSADVLRRYEVLYALLRESLASATREP